MNTVKTIEPRSNAGATIRDLFRPERLKRELLGRFGVLLALIILMAVFTVLSPVFLTTGNMSNILVQAGTNALIAAGMTFVILSGEIDLSVGSTLALSSVIGTRVMVDTGSIWLGILCALAVGTTIGLFNGYFVAHVGLPSFIVTLATMWLARGSAYVFTGGQAITGLPKGFRVLANGDILGIPNIILLTIIGYAIVYFVLSQTTIGRRIFASGDNKEAARLSGVNVNRTKMLVFAVSGFMAALAGIVLSSRLFSGQPIAGISFELSAIAAVVIGGTSLSGGVGGVLGTLVGAIFIATLLNGLVILNVSSFWQQVLMGAVVLLAVLIDKARKSMTVH